MKNIVDTEFVVRICPICKTKPNIVEFRVSGMGDLIRLECNCNKFSGVGHWQLFHPLGSGLQHKLIYCWDVFVEEMFDWAIDEIHGQ